MTNSNVNPIPPIVPGVDSGLEDDMPTRENADGETVIDPDADADQVDSAEADRAASGADGA